MKRSLSLLLAALVLLFALTACGRRNDTAQNNSQNGTQSESAVTGKDPAGGGNTGTHDSAIIGGNGASGHAGSSLPEDAGNAVQNGLDDMEHAVDDMAGNAARHRTDSGPR